MFKLTATSAQTPDPTSDPGGGQFMNSGSHVILEPLPEDASEADYGEQLYILVCRACHGDLGRGLTADWINQWHPDDRNCWQSKCHAANSPSDGFEFPHIIPPIIGDDALTRYNTAFDLFQYIKATMPYQDPGALPDLEYWQIVAFLLRENGIVDDSIALTPELAVNLELRPVAQGEATAPANTVIMPSVMQEQPRFPWAVVVGGAAILVLVVVILWRLLGRRVVKPEE